MNRFFGKIRKVTAPALLAFCLLLSEGVKPVYAADQRDAGAYAVYSVMSAFGIPDVNIAGMLGNYSVESGIDPTSVESIYDEKYQIGPQKMAALGDLDAFTRSRVFSVWENQGVSLNYSGYQGSDGAYCGMGLAQWTGPSAERMTKTASALGKDWYDLDFQIAYMLSDNYRPGVLASWKTPEASPEDAALWFLRNYEGGTPSSGGSARTAAAREFYDKIQTWKANDSYAETIFDLASQMGDQSLWQSGLRPAANETQKLLNAVLRAVDQQTDNSLNDILETNGESFLKLFSDETEWKKIGYLKSMDPAEIKAGDWILFEDKPAIVIHEEGCETIGESSDGYLKKSDIPLQTIIEKSEADICVYRKVNKFV